ncbi:guanylate-binding protein 7-like [Hemitrygon akajei]|uniref:guanylate-binding protein 7-like n=1 Tax=Hemitrygon akajei TaxID=2704970 RepID=UPI003BF99D03
MVVVAVVGAVLTGKSYLMNCLAGDKNGFSLNSTAQAHTKGIWMWCRSLPQRPNEVLLLLDTKGLGVPEKGDSHNDNSIFSLVILLSSILIYNGEEPIDQQSLQHLRFVTELSKRIQMKSQPDGCNSWDCVRFFPEFVWVIRDLTRRLRIEGKPVTPNEYLEHSLKLKDSEISEQDKEYNELRRCIRNHFPSRCCFAFPIPTHWKKLEQLQDLEDKDLDEDFVKERQNLINYIHTKVTFKVKRVVEGQLVTGRRFVELTEAYVGMMADGVLPCVERSVAKLEEVENQAAVDEALKFYDNEMKKISESDCLTMSKLIEYYNMKSIEAFNIFHRRSMNNNSDKHIEQLEETMSSTYKSLIAKIKEKSQEECETHLKEVMSPIKENLKSGHYLRPGGFQELKKHRDKAIEEYEERTKNEMEGWAVLTHFLEEEKSCLDQVQKMDSKLTEQQKRVPDISEEDCLMSVTKDPLANKQKMDKPLQLVCNKDGKLQLNPEALKVLQSIKDPMVVVAVVGAARTGKSYLMNCLAGGKNGFSVDSTVQSHTKGIWMWCRSLPQRPNEVLLLLDTEGLGDPEKGDLNHDNSINLLAILLSSIFIYNGQRNIDQQSLQDLHFVTELSKRIQMKSQPNACDRWDFVRFFPEFVWLIRDFTLKLKIDRKDVTPNEYLEHRLKLKDGEISEQDKKYNELRRCIRDHFPSRCCFAFPIPTYRKKLKQLQELEDKDLNEEFFAERQNLINYIHTHKKVKSVVGGQLVTGRRFVELTKMYVGMMADGVLPCVESCVAKLEEVENQAALDEALKFYDEGMKKFPESNCLTMSKLTEYYNMKMIAAFHIFHKRCMNNSGKYIIQLEERMSSTYKSVVAKIKKKSQEECETHLKKVMSSMKENLKSRCYQRPGGFQELKKDLDKAIKEYKEKTKDEVEGWVVLTHFLEDAKLHLDLVQAMDSRLTEEQKRVSALEEELSWVKHEMEKVEQKRKAFEECRNKEIMEQIRKKLEEGKMCTMEELKETMEHIKSEMEKYEDEGRMDEVERAQQRYDYLKKKYEEATELSSMKFIRKRFVWHDVVGQRACIVM